MPNPLLFRAPMTRRLRRLGLKGADVTVGLAAEAIGVGGDDGTLLRLNFAGIARIRVGFSESKGGSYHFTRIWLTGERRPIEFMGSITTPAAYSAFVRGMVAWVLERYPGIEVQAGSGWFMPLFTIGAFGAMSLASLGGSIYLAVTGDDWTIFLGALAVSLVLLLGLGFWTWTRHRPRRIATVEALARVLPA
ncbi:hypothetical protein ACQW02_22685 [Humitalea sp. 24SJ18S-53]|uniref:hypothetical protein n=1 Tax=Humitalea sp. 24SJ18S-53 TaxID=3422307 RepID=UPI003D6672A0